MPMTREMRGFSSKQFLGQYTLKKKGKKGNGWGVEGQATVTRQVGNRPCGTWDSVWPASGRDTAAPPWFRT